MSILSEILATGHVDKELLDALDDEQKQLLFCQMRAEQVRRWDDFEDRMDREGPAKKDPKKRPLRWLTGPDGDVWVWVMGDHPQDPSIDQILDDEARKEAHLRALRELSNSEEEKNGAAGDEASLKVQLSNMRLGAVDSMYDDADSLFDSHQPLLFQKTKTSHVPDTSVAPNPVATTTVSSYTVPQPQKAELRGPPPPVPVKPWSLSRQQETPIMGDTPTVVTMPSSSGFSTENAINGVRLRPNRGMNGNNKENEIKKRESEILLSIQEKREKTKREAEAEAERQRIEWEEQNRKAREAECAMRAMAQRAREQHRQLIRTSASILPALSDSKATSLREAIKNLPRPPKPKSRSAIIEWFRRDELPRGTGFDPKTRAPAPWFHGIISREQAEILLNEKPAGAYLVRVSERIWGYTVSYVVGDGSYKHFLVERISEGYQFLGTNQVVHEQLFDLVSYHEDLMKYGDRFGRVYACVTRLLLTQQKKDDIKEPCVLIVRSLDEFSDDGDEESEACRVAVIASMKMVAEKSVGQGKWTKDAPLIAQIIAMACQRLLSKDVSLKWTAHIRPLLCVLLSDTSGTTSELTPVLNALEALLRIVYESKTFEAEFLSSSSVPVFGKFVSVLLEAGENCDRDPDTRVQCMRILLALVSREPMLVRPSLCMVLPGVLSRCAAIACQSATENTQIIVTALQIFSKAAVICLSAWDETQTRKITSEPDVGIKGLAVERTTDWRTSTVAQTVQLMSVMFARLAVHRNVEIRKAIFGLGAEVYFGWESLDRDSLNGPFVDLCFVLVRDPYMGVKVFEMVERVRLDSPEFFSLHVADKMRILAERLPSAVRQSGDVGPLISQLCSLLRCQRECIDRLCVSRAGSLLVVLRALSVSIRVDLKRLLITSNGEPTSCIELLCSVPLQFGLTVKDIADVCKELSVASSEVCDVLLSEMDSCSPADYPGLLVLTSLSTSSDAEAAWEFLEKLAENLSVLPFTQTVFDHTIQDDSIGVSPEVAKVMVELLSAGIAISAIDNQLVHKPRILLELLPNVLMLCSSGSPLLYEAADRVLDNLAKAHLTTVSHMLEQHAGYIVHVADVSTRDQESLGRATRLVSSLLDKSQERTVFPHVKHLVDAILVAIDSHKQEKTVQMLRVCRSYVRAVDRWEPHGAPPPEKCPPPVLDDVEEAMLDDAKPVPSDPISLVNRILIRTKHMLASPHLHVRVIVIDILTNGLWCLRAWDDLVLPMIHQNWQSLIHRFRDSEYDVRTAAIGTVERMAAISGTFVFRRVRDELFPLLVKELSASPPGLRAITLAPTFKYHMAVIEALVTICNRIEVTNDDVKCFEPLWKKLEDKEVHSKLRRAAVATRAAIDDGIASRAEADAKAKALFKLSLALVEVARNWDVLQFSANLDEYSLKKQAQELACGVYYGLARVCHGEVYDMVMSVGWNPHFRNEKKTLEVHLLHKFPGDFYGEELEAVALGFIREMKAFDSLDSLKKAIADDITDAQRQIASCDRSQLVARYFDAHRSAI